MLPALSHLRATVNITLSNINSYQCKCDHFNGETVHRAGARRVGFWDTLASSTGLVGWVMGNTYNKIMYSYIYIF